MRYDVCDKCDYVNSINTYFEENGGRYFIIKNVPCKKCFQCGDIAYGVMTMTKIEKFILDCKEDKEVVVVDYNDVLKIESKDFAVA